MASPTPPPFLDDDVLIGSQSEDWVAKYSTYVTLVLGVIVLGLAGWFFWTTTRTNKQENQTAVFTEAFQSVLVASQETETTKRLTMLRDASLANIKLADDIKGSPLARQALLIAGNALFEAAYGQPKDVAVENLTEALTIYDRFLASAATDEERALANLARGNALDNLAFFTGDTKKVDEARTAYESVNRLAKGSAMDLEARLGVARLYMAQAGREQEARPILESVIRDSKAFSATGITKTMRDASPLTTITVTVDGREKEFTQAELEKIRDTRSVSLGGIAEDLLKRLPALTTTTTGSATAKSGS